MKNKREINHNKLKQLISIREFLFQKIEENKKYNLRKLSKLLGRNDAYLQQYIKRGSPNYLPEEERIKLSDILEINFNELTPSWLWKNKIKNNQFYKIKKNDKNFILISKIFFKDLNFSNIKNLYIHELTLNKDSKNISFIRVIVDTGINYFEDENDYILDDNNNLFLANLSIDSNHMGKELSKLVVKPFEKKYNSFRINSHKLKIYGKIIFKSKNIFY